MLGILGPLQCGLFYHSLLNSTDRPESQGSDIEQIRINFNMMLDVDALQQAWSTVLARHPILSASFRMEGDAPIQEIRDRIRIRLEVKDWSDRSDREYNEDLEAFVQTDRRRGFVLSHPPLMRVTVMTRPDGGMDMLWTVHLIVADGRSIYIVLLDVIRAYEAYARGETPDLGPPPPP